MEPVKWTSHSKYGRAYQMIKEQYGTEAGRDFLQAICEYGWFGTEPEGYDFAALLSANNFREDIDNSKAAFVGGEKSAESRRKKAAAKRKAGSDDNEEPGSGDSQEPGSGEPDEPPSVNDSEPPSTDSDEPGSDETAEPIQPNPKQPNPKKRHKFHPPTVDEVKAYCEEKGFTHVDPGGFVGYYDSVGWKVGKNRKQMVSWRGACSSWESRERKNHEAKEGIGDEYADL